MAAAVERIDGVTGGELACDFIPDLGDKAGTVQQQCCRLAGIRLAPSRQRDVLAGRSDRNAM
jgi:hypothetical protein